MVIWEPHGHAATRLVEVGVRTVDISDIYTTTFNFLAMDVLLEQQPEVLARFLQAIEKAEDFIEAQDQDAQTIVANRLGVPLEDVSLFWNDFVFDLTMDQHWLVNIEHEARWAIQNALVEAEVIPNYLEWIYTDAMRAVSSATVTIVE